MIFTNFAFLLQELKDLIKRILVLSPAQRLGVQKRGAADIKEHAWFNGFDWRAFASGESRAPYTPKVHDLSAIECPLMSPYHI